MLTDLWESLYRRVQLQTLIKNNIESIQKYIEQFEIIVNSDIKKVKKMLISYSLIIAEKKS